MMTIGGWKPLLTGPEAAPYRAVVHEIVASLEQRSATAGGKNGAVTDWGLPLLYSYLAREGDERARAEAESLVEEAVSAMGERPLPLSLYGGVAGISWLSSHVDTVLGNTEDADAYEEIDRVLAHACDLAGPEAVYDLISGPVGFGVYFIQRSPRDSAQPGMAAVLRFLERRCDRKDGGVTWFTPPELIHEVNRASTPGGYYNLGVAHGVPGPIGVLSRIARHRVFADQAMTMLREAATWLVDRLPPDRLFPAWIGPGIVPTAARIAWCYGSLGISVVLLDASAVLQDREVEAAAIQIATGAAAVTEAAGAVDCCLCHGSAGNAHLFNRLYQATGRTEFREAAIYWLEATLSWRRPAQGIAGFVTWMPTDMGRTRIDPWLSDPSFLSGAAGIGLALLAATSAVEPNWDCVLLSDIRAISARE